jgi:hypothetical protein
MEAQKNYITLRKYRLHFVYTLYINPGPILAHWRRQRDLICRWRRGDMHYIIWSSAAGKGTEVDSCGDEEGAFNLRYKII